MVRRWKNGMRRMIASGALAVALLATQAHAKIDLVTLPNRDATELTIYNSEDLTLVRETRTLSFTKGINQIQFSWANTLIDPTSLHIDLGNRPGLEVLDAVYPTNTRDLIIWNIEATEEVAAPVEIVYFTSGLTWSSEYTVITNEDETNFQVQQFVAVRNNSGEDFENAHTRVVVGTVNLVEVIALLAQRGIRDEGDMRRQLGRDVMSKMEDRSRPAAPMAAGAAMFEADEAKEIIKKAVSEYYLFAVEGEESIANGWGKSLPNPVVEKVPFDLSYEINPAKFGNLVVKFYKLKNDEKHELGETPLPQGVWYVYSRDGRDGLRFQGRTDHKYVPVGEDVELNLGTDGLVLYEAKVMNTAREDFEYDSSGNVTGWIEKQVVEVDVKNSQPREVPIKMTLQFPGDWEFVSVSDNYERVDQTNARWQFTVPASSTRTITYTTATRMGTRARR